MSQQTQDQGDEMGRLSYIDVMRALALVLDESLLPEDCDCEDLFDRGFVRQWRDITDEYQVDFTKNGAQAIREILAEGVAERARRLAA